MKHFVLGTAGHIDHGKTALTKALTGTDTDRLQEEKKRGISIELGYAAFSVGEYSLSVVDVPGHEKFIKTMMSGADGIDAVLLTVAADDGVMPQTKEHLNILRLLGIEYGLVVMTKCDLTELSRQNEVETQIRALLRGSFLENAPICRVCAISGQGIDDLKEEIEMLCRRLPQNQSEKPFRMAIDRAFSLPGFGTLAAGSITEGHIQTSDELMLYPQKVRGSIRTMQAHGNSISEAFAGMRAAFSFSGLVRDSVSKGGTLAQADSMLVTSMLDVSICITPDCPYPIRNAGRLHLFHGAAQTVCTLRLLDADVLTAGQTGFAQLKLETPVAVRYGDRYVIRFFSPVLTVGGGVILSADSGRLRRKNGDVLSRLKTLSEASTEEKILAHIRQDRLMPKNAEILRMLCNLPESIWKSAMQKLIIAEKIYSFGQMQYVATDVLQARFEQIKPQMQAFHAKYPFQQGMRSAMFYSRFFADCEAEKAAEYLRKTQKIKKQDDFFSLPEFFPTVSREFIIMRRKLLHFYKEQGLFAPDINAVFEKFAARGEVLQQAFDDLKISGGLVFLSPRYAVHPEHYQHALAVFRSLFTQERQNVTLAEYKNAAGISRKYAQLFLEYFDRQQISRRMGEGRILLKKDSL